MLEVDSKLQAYDLYVEIALATAKIEFLHFLKIRPVILMLQLA
nr:hypothetical protein [Ectobacillus panaciterrae]